MTATRASAYAARERVRAACWKLTSPSLPAAARQPAPYVGKDGRSSGPRRDFCLPAQHAHLSLLPEVRGRALDLFAELGIPWHAGVAGGPSNHLLSSQVQCVNALGQAVTEPERLVRALGEPLGIGELLEVEPGRYVTFEYIGPEDVFGEVLVGERVRGARCTSLDAAFVHRARDGALELVLLEWKYTESYLQPRQPEPLKDVVRRERYASALALPDSPLRADLLPFEDLLDEPLYQRVRQQLLAAELERRRVLGADRVRVVHVAPAGNVDLQGSLVRPSTHALGRTVDEVWQRLLRRSDRFTLVDSAVFLDPEVTSAEYCARYGTGVPPDTARVVRGSADLRRLTGCADLRGLEHWLGLDGDLDQDEDGLHLTRGVARRSVAYPFLLDDLQQAAEALEREPGTCSSCGRALVPVVYGYPGLELVEAWRRGEVVLGGCTVVDDQPAWACPTCESAP